MLRRYYIKGQFEAGCDEAGRGCLAGPVFAAAVIIPHDFKLPGLNDSKQLSVSVRESLRYLIEEKAIAWAVASCDHREIDDLNILNASILAMHRALENLTVKPDMILVDGNRFKNFKKIKHHCIVKGDSLFQSIAAASVLAKTHRDEFMMQAHRNFPVYGWDRNKAYPTQTHIQAIASHGFSPLHRMTFKPRSLQTGNTAACE